MSKLIWVLQFSNVRDILQTYLGLKSVCGTDLPAGERIETGLDRQVEKANIWFMEYISGVGNKDDASRFESW